MDIVGNVERKDSVCGQLFVTNRWRVGEHFHQSQLWQGYDTLHTDDLPDREETEDNYIRQVANQQQRILITKDADFYDSYLLRKQPAKLLSITTGKLKTVN